ncbi:hypothetical protein SAMN04488503_3162 [Humidesulfovibrio mexicanus]|uniref:Uncharacterized protein n=1 Tax=Humidesulfovibrio mexicanus TaxID=147047 RepID=A0A239CKI7_9BACT|nr:hypothetical protein [Humidesulfovibrio mexicanus]SNS20208.1 hypothetical protein SAMN04488503_3162 [Humidesulfovibrio mexicanus]
MTAPNRLTAASRPLSRLAAALVLAGVLLAPASPAFAVSDDAVLRRMDAVIEENNRLRDEAWKAKKHGKEAARQAQEALDASDARLERTRAEALAHVAGVSPAQVETLRRDGKSWGQAAGELGVHPGFLGVGKTPLYQSLPKAKKAGSKIKAKGKGGKKHTLKAKGKSTRKAVKKAPTTKKNNAVKKKAK